MTDLLTALNATPRPDLTDPECADLILAFRAGDAAAARTLLRVYMGPLVNEAHRVTKFANSIGRGDDDTFDEAFSEATRIFYSVLASFDIDRGMHGFVNYLTMSLRNDEAMNVRRGNARVPQRTLYRRNQIIKAADGDLTEARRLAPSMGMPLATFDAVTAALAPTEGVGAGGARATSESGSRPEDEETRVPAELQFRDPGYVRVEDLQDAARALDALDYVPRLIVESIYGLNGQPVQSAAEIGKMLGMSRWAVQRRLDAAMVDMKSALTEQEQS